MVHSAEPRKADLKLTKLGHVNRVPVLYRYVTIGLWTRVHLYWYILVHTSRTSKQYAVTAITGPRTNDQ